MLGQVRKLVENQNNKVIKLDCIVNDMPSILQFSDLLHTNPDKCPVKFQFRVDENYLSTLNVGQIAQFYSIITDLEIMSCVNFNMIIFKDEKENQIVYQFTRK